MKEHENIQNFQVVVVAGGAGERLKHRTGENVPKALLKIGDKTLLEVCIDLFSSSGLKDFVFLIGHLGEEIKNFIGDGKKFGINARYSIEQKKLGKAGALKLALQNGAINKNKPCIITYPDDLIILTDFPAQLIAAHLEGLKKGCLATVVKVDRTQYRFGVPRTNAQGIVTKFEEKPLVEVPANVAIYVLEPAVYKIIDKLVNLSEAPIDFEGKVVPKLVEKKLLYSFTIPHQSWVAVNEEKEFRLAEKLFGGLG